MYMNQPQNYKEWADHRAKYNVDWKEKQQAKEKRKSEVDAADPPNKSAGGNLYHPKASNIR